MGGVRETGEERAGGGISTMGGSGREIKKGKLLLFVTAYFQSKKRPQERFLTSTNVFRGLQQNFIHEKSQKTKIRARDKKKTALLPVKLETFPSRLHHRT